MQTVYVSEPPNLHDAWANLARLLAEIKAIFDLMEGATETDDSINWTAQLGEELTEEAEKRAKTLRDFVRDYTQEKPAARRAE